MNAPKYDPDNVFAKILRGDLPSHTVFEDDDTVVIMDIMPRGDGHCLVLPRRAARNILDVTEADLAAVARTTRKAAAAAVAAFEADGVTIQQFNEPAGGQVVFHLHVHVIPRFEGIKLRPHTGEMADPETLKANAERLRGAFAQV